jgi:hypothetical protein
LSDFGRYSIIFAIFFKVFEALSAFLGNFRIEISFLTLKHVNNAQNTPFTVKNTPFTNKNTPQITIFLSKTPQYHVFSYIKNSRWLAGGTAKCPKCGLKIDDSECVFFFFFFFFFFLDFFGFFFCCFYYKIDRFMAFLNFFLTDFGFG